MFNIVILNAGYVKTVSMNVVNVLMDWTGNNKCLIVSVKMGIMTSMEQLRIALNAQNLVKDGTNIE